MRVGGHTCSVCCVSTPRVQYKYLQYILIQRNTAASWRHRWMYLVTNSQHSDQQNAPIFSQVFYNYNMTLKTPTCFWNVTLTWVPDDDPITDRNIYQCSKWYCNIKYLGAIYCFLLDWLLWVDYRQCTESTISMHSVMLASRIKAVVYLVDNRWMHTDYFPSVFSISF
jgi:hypothetical protein